MMTAVAVVAALVVLTFGVRMLPAADKPWWDFRPREVRPEARRVKVSPAGHLEEKP